MLLGGITVFADEVTYPVSGECGTNVTWSLDAEGNLTVSGAGAMEYQNRPWDGYKDNIKTVTIEQGVTNIAQGAFSSLSNLKKATLADSVTSIGYAGFAGCSNLTEINLPDSITEIGEYAFTATALRNVTLPSNLRTVKSQLFSGCRSLEYVYIPDSVTVIEESVFSGSSVKTVRLSGNISYIPKGMFSNSDLESIELPSSIREIREGAFSSCHLTKITLPEGVEVLGNDAFSQCDRLKSVILPNSLRYIGENSVIEVVPELDRLAGKSLMITGAAGLVCSAIVDIIFRYNDTHDEKIQVLAAGRWPEEMSARFGDQVNREDFTFVVYDASKTDNVIDVHADYIIHGASNASPNMIVKEPVETMMSNFQ